MDPAVCYVQNGVQSCLDYQNGRGIIDTNDNITFIPGGSSFNAGGTAIWSYSRPITADNAEDKSLDSQTMTFVYAMGTYTADKTSYHGAAN